MDKTYASADEAVADIPSGASLAVGGFGLSGVPITIIRALLARGVRDLEVVSNNCGFDGWGQGFWRGVRSLLLPAVALGLFQFALLARTTRSALLEVLREEYVKTARAKGVAERAVLFRHALRNALIPIVTVAGVQLGQLLAGSIILESVFYLPGLGRLTLAAISARDLPVVQGVVLFVASMIVTVNAAVDILYGILDPRIRYG